MKKLLLSILTFIYMLSSTGVAMEVHYCMGKKSGFDFYKTGNKKCKKCGMIEKKSGCCKDEYKFYKLNTAYKNYNKTDQIVFSSVDVTDDFISKTCCSFSTCLKLICRKKYSPPDKNTPPIFILNCIFRL